MDPISMQAAKPSQIREKLKPEIGIRGRRIGGIIHLTLRKTCKHEFHLTFVSSPLEPLLEFIEATYPYLVRDNSSTKILSVSFSFDVIHKQLIVSIVIARRVVCFYRRQL